MTPVSRVRARAMLLVLVVAASALAGCFASGDDDTKLLKEYKRETVEGTRDEFRFSVAEGAEEIRIHLSTEPETQTNNNPYYCPETMAPGPCEDDDHAGAVRAELRDPDGEAIDEVRLGFKAKDSMVLSDPTAGQWTVRLSFEDGYEGPATIRVSEASGNVVMLGGDFWDIAGVVLTVLTAAGGFLLYRRRTNFLTRELNRIDQTYHSLGDDMEECRTNLIQLREYLKDLLVRRKIQESQYLILEKRIEQYLQDLAIPGNRYAAQLARGSASPAALPATDATTAGRSGSSAHAAGAAGTASDGWEPIAIDPDLEDTDSWVQL